MCQMAELWPPWATSPSKPEPQGNTVLLGGGRRSRHRGSAVLQPGPQFPSHCRYKVGLGALKPTSLVQVHRTPEIAEVIRVGTSPNPGSGL